MLYIGNMINTNRQNPVANLTVITPVWTEKFQKHENYYEGIVKSDEVDRIMELHKKNSRMRSTMTSYSTRRSIVSRQSKSSIDKNQTVHNRSYNSYN